MREINRIIIHCSDTPPDLDIGVEDIRRWHLERGFSDIGYHFVITRQGIIEDGRPVERMGAHARKHNRDSIVICLVGGRNAHDKLPDANYSFDQLYALWDLVWELVEFHGHDTEVLGHRDLPNVDKACPCFDVKSWMGGE